MLDAIVSNHKHLCGCHTSYGQENMFFLASLNICVMIQRLSVFGVSANYPRELKLREFERVKKTINNRPHQPL